MMYLITLYVSLCGHFEKLAQKDATNFRKSLSLLRLVAPSDALLSNHFKDIT